MSTLDSGRRAEDVAVEYVRVLGFEVLEQNYRRPHCEIDIVAQKDNTVYFIEVKYRSSDYFGGGLDYIAGNKLRHMQRGAETWVLSRHFRGPYQLSAIEVTGRNYEVTDFIQDIL